MSREFPLVVILGPTASGKSNLAIKLAKKFNGEIICADSRTIYKDMDIGTAKPNSDDQKLVRHWGLDLVSPGDYFSVSDFKLYADEKIKSIRGRNKVPFLVGGSGLYINSVIYNYNFNNKKKESLRNRLDKFSVDDLINHCKNNNIELPENYKNKRYLIKTIENDGKNSNNNKLLDNIIVVGISTEKNILSNRISSRVDKMFDQGLIDETKRLIEKYGIDNEAGTANAYRFVCGYLNNELSFQDMKNKIAQSDRKLIKKQNTWFKRDKNINWLKLDEAYEYIYELLNKIVLK